MINVDLIEYIKRQLQVGDSQKKIRSDLLANGWTNIDVDEAMRSNGVPVDLTPVEQSSPMRKPAKVVNSIWVVLLLMIIGGSGVFAYKIYTENKASSLISENEKSENTLMETLLVSSTTTPKSESAATPTTCTNSKCFTDAIKNCSSAKYRTNSKVEFLGSEIKSDFDFDLSGSNNKCLLSMTLLSYHISPSQELLNSMKGAEVIGPGPDEVYPKLNSDAQIRLVGKKGVCNITNIKDTVIESINKNSEIFLVVDPDYSICSGTLFVNPSPTNSKVLNVSPKNISDCNNVSFSSERAACIGRVAKSVEDCDVFSFSLDRAMCIKQLALKNGDASICALAAGAGVYSSIQNECYGEIAAQKNDYGICSVDKFEKIKSDSQFAYNMAGECVKKYCSIRGVDGWWGCGN